MPADAGAASADAPAPPPETPRRADDAPPPAVDYIPCELYLFFSVCSVGVYPYLWLLNRVDGLGAVGATGADRSGISRYCVLGICAQILLLACGAACFLGWAADARGLYAFSFLTFVVYAAVMLFLILPMRCFYHFDIRWRLRRAVSQWDEDGLMIPRTVPSLLLLCLFGTAYLQRHVNRLIGLGMPGFAGYDDLDDDAPFGGAIKGYVRGVIRRG